MLALRKIVADFVDCCDLRPGNAEFTNTCNTFLFPAALKEVTYSGVHYIEMKQDGDNNFGEPFPKPHYLSDRTDRPQSPIAGVMGLDITASTIFNGNDIYEKIKVRGKGDAKIKGVTFVLDFLEQTASQDPVSKQITVNLMGQLPNKIVFLDDFKIKWEIKVKKAGEPEGDWELVGESTNDWYLTLRPPEKEAPNTGYLHFHTLFDISCRYGGGDSDDLLIKGVWAHFASRQVKRADGQPLKYYGQWTGKKGTESIDSCIKYFYSEIL